MAGRRFDGGISARSGYLNESTTLLEAMVPARQGDVQAVADVLKPYV
jgi:hypothetical protein